VVHLADGGHSPITGYSVTGKLSHTHVTGTLFWLGLLSPSFWDLSQSYWDKRTVVLILRKGIEHSGSYVELGQPIEQH
jgi:hypothetical protein